MVRLIVSDLDGTLLRDDHTLSECTKAVIHKVSEQGSISCWRRGGFSAAPENMQGN